MGHRHAAKTGGGLKPRTLKRREKEVRLASHHAIQRATFNHLTAIINDPENPGCRISYADLEQRMRARSYQLSVASSRTCRP